ncbi:MAG: BamA/TamA family outer membrane protein [Chitinophagales bacterium]|nr:BamA/TamA family outer membrane protein [Chitinophagales bacterium]
MHPLWHRAIYMVLSLFLSIAWSSCGNTRYLTGNQVLLKENKIIVQSPSGSSKVSKNIEANQSLQTKLSALARQQPNKKTLGLFKLNLTIYNRFHTEKEHGFRYYMMTKIGEPPVLFDSTFLPASAQQMLDYTKSKGYLLAETRYNFTIKKKLATPKFYITPGPLYTVDSVFLPSDSSEIAGLVKESIGNTLIKTGGAFDSEVLSAEQQRIFIYIQNQGYFHFRPDLIYFEADTIQENKKVKVSVKVNASADSTNQKKYFIGHVYIFPNYHPEQNQLNIKYDSTLHGHFIFIDERSVIKPATLISAILLSEGDAYSRNNYNFTLHRIADLGIFKFISIRWKETEGSKLDCFIYLTPGKKHSVSAEVEASNIEDNVGAAVKLSYKNKNVFREANVLDFSLNAGTQIPVFNKDSLIFNLSGQLNLTLPRFLPNNVFVTWNPRTRLSLQVNYYKQTSIYVLTNYSIAYGYDLRKGYYRFLPGLFSISYINSSILSSDFQQRLESDPFLKQTFEDQLIIGPSLTAIFSNQNTEKVKNFTVLRISLEAAGTITYLANKALGDGNLENNHYSLLGTNYANFFRAEAEFRHYFQFTQNRVFVVRFSAGEAISYWNSEVIPYVKQFYLGGTNSLRAWRVRSVGPGSYNDTSAVNFFNSAGDIKLEANAEYRFTIFERMKGALFTDAGNIWLRKNDPNKPGANFDTNRFYKEIALGTGFGFRFDFTYFILRLDLATPLYNPKLIAGERWVINNFDPKSKDWRKQNLLFNLAIGYPF